VSSRSRLRKLRAEKRAIVITHRAPRRSPPRLVNPAPPPPILDERDPLGPLRERATVVRARRRQQLSLGSTQAETVYIVRSGMLLLQAQPPAKHRQLLSLLYPNDVFRAAYGPPFPGAALSAATATELWRLPARTFEALLGADALLAQHLNRQLADQHARAMLHVAMLGSLTGEEKVAAFLIELTLRLGAPCANGTSFELPLARIDIADYLALNADTLSRIMSRLKSRGLVAQTGRGRAIIPDWGRLCSQTPVADTLLALHGATGAASLKR
jgi:CRP/FNR family transcriptional regulator, anaerobic regulatory protein